MRTLALLALLVGCGTDDLIAEPVDSGSPTDATFSDAAKDAVAQDSRSDAPVDSGAADSSDASTAPDVAAGCDAGCKLFSSYCSSMTLKPCTCYPLAANQPNPGCNGSMVTCLVDPCLAKKAVCVDGACAVQ